MSIVTGGIIVVIVATVVLWFGCIEESMDEPLFNHNDDIKYFKGL